MAKPAHIFGFQIQPDGNNTVYLLSHDHGMTPIAGIIALERLAAERPSDGPGQEWVLTGKISYPDLDFGIEEDDITFDVFVSSKPYGKVWVNRDEAGAIKAGQKICVFDYMVNTVTPDDSDGIRRLNIALRINGDVTYKTAASGDAGL